MSVTIKTDTDSPCDVVVFNSYHSINNDVMVLDLGKAIVSVNDPLLPFVINVTVDNLNSYSRIAISAHQVQYRTLMMPLRFYYHAGTGEYYTHFMEHDTVYCYDSIEAAVNNAQSTLDARLCYEMDNGDDLYEFFLAAKQAPAVCPIIVPSDEVMRRVQQYMLDHFLRRQAIFQLAP